MAETTRSADAALTQDLLELVLRGALEFRDVEPALRALAPGGASPAAPYRLQRLLEQDGRPEFQALATRIDASILKAALRCHRARAAGALAHSGHAEPLLAHLPADLPLGWRDDGDLAQRAESLATMVRHLCFFEHSGCNSSEARSAVVAGAKRAKAEFETTTARWTYLAPRWLWDGFVLPDGAAALPPGADAEPLAAETATLTGLTRTVAAEPDTTAGRAALDRLLTWPGDGAARFVGQACTTPSTQRYAMQAIALRFGRAFANWTDCHAWLIAYDAQFQRRTEVLQRLAQRCGDALRLFWYREHCPQPDPALSAALEAAAAQAVVPALFVRQWEPVLTPRDVEGILRAGTAPAAPPLPVPPPVPLLPSQPVPAAVVAAAALGPVVPPVPPPLPVERPVAAASPSPVALRLSGPVVAPVGALPSAPATAPASAVAAGPSLWDEHIRPFLAANSYMLAGLLMVVAGASLLAYFTWDKSALVRYLCMPTLLAAFTVGLAELGVRLGRRHGDLRGTGAFLSGGAISLLPLNFMVLCLVGRDTSIPAPLLVLLALTAVYVLAFGAGLRRWSQAVEPGLSAVLALPLLALNSLAALAALAAHSPYCVERLPVLLPAAMSLGGFVVLLSGRGFLTRVLTRERLDERRVVWFFIVTQVATALQVFAWVHLYLQTWPQPEQYALLVVLLGGGLLTWERRVLELRERERAYGGEAFLGYAALFTGILMAARHPALRIVVLVLAGLIWLAQARRRPGLVHPWVGLTLMLLGGAAIGQLEAFPKSRELNLLPALGIGLALVTGALRALAGRWLRDERLRVVAMEMQAPLLLLTATVSVLSQWHFRSEPWQTGLTLLAITVFFLVRAVHAVRRHWLHTAMAMGALALPYLGCADMSGYSLRGNTLDLGLALLSLAWLAGVYLTRLPLLLKARSAVVTVYGLFGVAAVAVHLGLGRAAAGSYLHPAAVLLLAAALGVAAWHSRSLVPGLAAAVLLAVFLPELRLPPGPLQALLRGGSGLPSAAAGLALVLACFALRPQPRLKGLGAGDEFAEGLPFALRRTDASLFTIPLMSMAFWLGLRVCILIVGYLRVQYHDGGPAVAALFVCAALWLLAAVYLCRRPAAGRCLFHLAWLTVAVAFVDLHRLTSPGLHWQHPALWTGLVLQALALLWAYLPPRYAEVCTVFAPTTRRVLSVGTLALALAVTLNLVMDCELRSAAWLAAFVGVRLAWDGLRRRNPVYGSFLFVLVQVVLWVSQVGSGLGLAAQLTWAAVVWPVLWLAVGVLAALLALEWRPAWQAFLAPLVGPFLAGSLALSVVLALVVGGLMVADPGGRGPLTLACTWLLVGVLLAAARAQAMAPFALLAVALAYLQLMAPTANLRFEPWCLGLLGLGLGLAPYAGRFLRPRWPRLLCGRFAAQPTTAPQAAWFAAAALPLATLAAIHQVILSGQGQADAGGWLQTSTLFSAVFTYAALGGYWRSATLWSGAAVMLAVADAALVYGGCTWRSVAPGMHGRLDGPTVTGLLLCAVLWLAGAVLQRRRPALARGLYHLAWLSVAMAFVHLHQTTAPVFHWQHPALWTALTLQALAFPWAYLQPRYDWVGAVFASATRRVLSVGTLILALAVALNLVLNCDLHRAAWLATFVAARLVWDGLRRRQPVHGAFLFGLVQVVLWASQVGAGQGLLVQWTWASVAWPVLWLAAGVLILLLALEWRPAWEAFLAPVLGPFQAGSTAMAMVLALLAGACMVADPSGRGPLGPALTWSLVVVLLAVARAQAAAPFALLALLLAYLEVMAPVVDLRFEPWCLGLLGLGLSLAPYAGRSMRQCWPRLLYGRFPQLPASAPQAAWFAAASLPLGMSMAVYQGLLSALGRADAGRWLQTSTLFSGVLAYAALGGYWQSPVLFSISAVALVLANIAATAILVGRDLLDFGLSELHLACIGIVVSVAEFHLIVRLSGRRTALVGLVQACSVLAVAVLVLLALNYLAYPDLAVFPQIRCIISGLLALAAGLYLRQEARQPDTVGTPRGAWLESLYHVGLGVALWCLMLLIPELRRPSVALYALALPPIVFWALAEQGARATAAAERATGERFRDSAAGAAALILVLYAARSAVQMLLFPNQPFDLHTYHVTAPLVLVVGLLLFRLRGLGGSDWLATYGGLALMTGSYFSLTAYPGLSPFDHPMASAWAGAGLAHVLVLLSYRQSPLRALLQNLGGIRAADWDSLRRGWGRVLLVAVHVLVLWGLHAGLSGHSREATPLIVLGAGLLVHQGILGNHRWYHAAAMLEVLLALHLGFLLPANLPSLLPARQVVWAVLGVWLGLVLARAWLRLSVATVAQVAGGLLAVCLCHVLYLQPQSGAGLLAVVGITAVGALTPVPAVSLGLNAPLCLLFLAVPTWLLYFWPIHQAGSRYLDLGPLLSALFGLLATGTGVAWYQRQPAADGTPLAEGTSPRFLNSVLAFCRSFGDRLNRAVLGVLPAGLGLLTLAYGSGSGGLPALLALALLWLLTGVAWFREGLDRPGVVPNALGQLCLAGMCLVLRQQFWRLGFWRYEYDIWAMLGLSTSLGAAKRLLEQQERGLRLSLTGTLWVLPVLELAWAQSHHLGPDILLVTLGLQSVIFVYLGGGRRESPYNAVALLGFVAFVLLFFWTKLDLRYLHAYSIPVGLGILGLLHLFGRDLDRGLRNGVRLGAVLAMLGSTGYYVLTGEGYSVGFHLTMLLLCCGVMGLGPLLKVQVYLYLGLGGLATDLVALFVKLVRHADQTLRMMSIGAVLLALGVALVSGAAYVKTHREQILARGNALRRRLGDWE